MTLLSGDGMHSSPLRLTLGVEEFRGRRVPGWMPTDVQHILSSLLDEFEVDSVIEVGSYLGFSACWFAERVSDVVCVDRFDRTIKPEAMMGATGDHYALFLHNTEAYPNITSYKMASLVAAELDLKADLVYIDAGHEYDDVKADVEAWTPHARKVICGDDNSPDWPGVQQYAREIDANVEGRVWWKSLS